LRSVLAARMAFLVMIVLVLGAGVGLLLAMQGDDDSVQAPNSATSSPPAESPATKTAREFEEGLQASFVTPDVPTDLTAGCDPSWVRTTFEQVKAVICHPADWVVDQTNGNVRRGVTVVTVTLPRVTETAGTLCVNPLIVSTPFGPARICALAPNEFGQGHGVILPSGRHAAVGIDKAATAEEKTTAFRILANVEVFP